MKKIIFIVSILLASFISISCTSCRTLFYGYNFWRVARWECNEFNIILYKSRQNLYDEYLKREVDADGEIKINNIKRGFVFFIANNFYDVHLAFYSNDPNSDVTYHFLYADVSVKENDKIMYWTITMCTIDESYVGKKIAFDRIDE